DADPTHLHCQHTHYTPPTSLYSSFSPTPHPAQSPLFPYTTLFRSTAAHRRTATHARPPLLRSGRGMCRSQPRLRGRPSHTSTRSDRKSTRLNSSHRTTSYAVFCVKKKIRQ